MPAKLWLDATIMSAISSRCLRLGAPPSERGPIIDLPGRAGAAAATVATGWWRRAAASRPVRSDRGRHGVVRGLTTGGPSGDTIDTSWLDEHAAGVIGTQLQQRCSAGGGSGRPPAVGHALDAGAGAGRPHLGPAYGGHVEISGYRSVVRRQAAAAVHWRGGNGGAGGAASRLAGRAPALRGRNAGSPPGDGEREQGGRQSGSIPLPSSHPSSPPATVTGHAVALLSSGSRHGNPAPRTAAVVAGGGREKAVRPGGRPADVGRMGR